MLSSRVRAGKLPLPLSPHLDDASHRCHRWPRLLCLLRSSSHAVAQAAKTPLTRADSALVLRILTAEDRRDASSAALREGASNTDPRIRLIARRAAARIGDAKFAARDSLPAIAPPPSYPDAPWRARYRAIGTRPVSCDSLRAALSDSVWAVRLHAADLAPPACASDATIMSTLAAVGQHSAVQRAPAGRRGGLALVGSCPGGARTHLSGNGAAAPAPLRNEPRPRASSIRGTCRGAARRHGNASRARGRCERQRARGRHRFVVPPHRPCERRHLYPAR